MIVHVCGGVLVRISARVSVSVSVVVNKVQSNVTVRSLRSIVSSVYS